MRDQPPLRAILGTAVQSQENSLDAEQLRAFYWGLMASLSQPYLLPGMPEHALLNSKLLGTKENPIGIYSKALAASTKQQLDVSQFPVASAERFEAIRKADLGLEWILPDQPVVKSLLVWTRTD
jgi:hypothetical protein